MSLIDRISFAGPNLDVTTDMSGCSANYGYPLPPACATAFAKIPSDTGPWNFRHFPQAGSDNQLQVPLEYKDDNANPTCIITIDLDGHSDQDGTSEEWSTFPNIKAAASHVISQCVEPASVGVHTPRWWEFPLAPTTPQPSNVDYHCVSRMGSPGEASCDQALFEFPVEGDATLDPSSPIIKTSGNCAVSIRSGKHQTASWQALAGVAIQLINRCVVNPGPFSRSKGGWARGESASSSAYPVSLFGNFNIDASLPIGHVVTARRWKRDEIDLDPQITIDTYYQPAFDGNAADTCQASIAAAHRGDVNKCPVGGASHSRPPPRRLLDGYSEAQNGTGSTVTANGTSFTLADANLTSAFEHDYDDSPAPAASPSDSTTWANNTETWPSNDP
ncbi:uncharacterized protein KY384_005096 [Bacidia gigantensis]|uniref:uncharacterized protein n=1 Tax=Bacidia gigantensis TaxID=2732470 RepID=UPI001D039B7A|nr:uncharacterized protein KY384_005096 [Bacidia gigantensis]KAG8530593.1 hypothetical protein KY384_005096 [Bacidia gigantensis]